MSIRFFFGVRPILSEQQEQFLSERSSYNTQQLKLAMMFTLPVCVFLLIRFFLSGMGEFSDPLFLIYPAAYSGLILVGILFLLTMQGSRARLSLVSVNRIHTVFIVLLSLLLTGITVMDIIHRQELYSYLILLLFLSVVIWLDAKVYTLFSLLSLLVVLFSLIVSGTKRGEPFSIWLIQVLIYFVISWFLYFSLTSLLMENFFNRISLEEQYQQLATESITDPLTGLYNKRSLQEDLKNEWARSVRKGVPFCVVLLDIDHFRIINETYGHTNGDSLIRELAVLLRNLVRLSDKVYRYGGEEFLILVSEAVLEIAVSVSSRIRESVEQNHFSGIRKIITVSIGIAQSDEKINADILIKRAEQKLLLAKQSGRNRIEY